MKFAGYDEAITVVKRLIPGASVKENSIVLPKHADVGLAAWRALDAIRKMSNKVITREVTMGGTAAKTTKKKEKEYPFVENVRVGEPAPGVIRGFRLGNVAHFDKKVEPDSATIDVTGLSEFDKKVVIGKVLKWRT